MAAPYVPNTAYIYFKCQLNGRQIGFGYHAEFLTPPYVQADIDNLADVSDAIFTSGMLPLLSVSCLYIETVVTGLNAAIDLQATDNDGSGFGGNANTPAPNNVSYVIKHSTGFTGRSARGRSYMIAIPLDALDTNEDFIDTAQRDAYVDFFDDFDVVLDAAGWDAVVVSRYSGGALRATPLTTSIIAHTATDLKLDTRRKRLG